MKHLDLTAKNNILCLPLTSISSKDDPFGTTWFEWNTCRKWYNLGKLWLQAMYVQRMWVAIKPYKAV